MTALTEKRPARRSDPARSPVPPKRRKAMKSPYPTWFYIPAGVFYVVLFLVPTVASLYFSLTRWTLFDSTFIGFENFVEFFQDPALSTGFVNTFIYAAITSGLKIVLGMALGLLLSSQIIGRGFLRSVVFFPVLVSTIGIGITFKVLLDPFDGLVNQGLAAIGVAGPGWLTDPQWALFSVALVDVWKGALYFLPGDENATVQLTLYNFSSQSVSSWNLLFMDVLLITIPPLVMYIFFNRQIVAGMTSGAVKG